MPPPRTQNGLPFFGRLSTIPLFLTLPAWPFGLVIGTVVRAPLTGNRLALFLITGSNWPLPWWTTSMRLFREPLVVTSPFTMLTGSTERGWTMFFVLPTSLPALFLPKFLRLPFLPLVP